MSTERETVKRYEAMERFKARPIGVTYGFDIHPPGEQFVLATDYAALTAQREADQVARDEAKEQTLRVVRGEFSQICSYCGWEAPKGGAQWEDLQAHIQACPKHPIPALQQRCEALERERDIALRSQVYGLSRSAIVEMDSLKQQLQQAQQQATGLREALEMIAAYGVTRYGEEPHDGLCIHGCDCPHIARQALAPPQQAQRVVGGEDRDG